MLDFRRLALLRAVAANGSISGAAQALSYTPSAASQQMRLLERDLGLRLVERTSQGTYLTPAGSVLLGHAQAILGRAAAAQEEMQALAAVQAGRLRLAVFPTAGAAFMPAAIATFARRHPGVELRLIEEETDEALLRLDRREVDLVVGYDFDEALRPGPEISQTGLLQDQMRLVLPAAHPLLTRDRLRLRDLSQEPWISSRPHQPCSRALASACAATGFAPDVVYQSDDYATVHELVAAGVGIAMVPDLAANRTRQDVEYRDTVPALPVRHVFATIIAGGAPAAAAMTDILKLLTTATTL